MSVQFKCMETNQCIHTSSYVSFNAHLEHGEYLLQMCLMLEMNVAVTVGSSTDLVQQSSSKTKQTGPACVSPTLSSSPLRPKVD